jgi:hypothetical protein
MPIRIARLAIALVFASVTLSFATTLSLPLLLIRQELAQRLPQLDLSQTKLEVALVPNLTQSLTQVKGGLPNGNAFTHTFAPDNWATQSTFDFAVQGQNSGRYFVAYRPLDANGKALTPYRLLTQGQGNIETPLP